MADNKIEKALYGPSLMEVLLGAVLGVFVGLVAAAAYLVFKPVLTVRDLPKDQPRGTIYYIAGSDNSTKGKTYQAKQKQFIAGARVQVNEDELNAWAGSAISEPVVPQAKPGKPGEPVSKPAPDGFVIPGKPNFRLINGKMQIGMKCTLNWYGFNTDVTIQSTGTFTKDGDMFVFTPETIYLGSCPLHMLPMLPGLLMAHVISNEKVADDVKAAWAKLGEVRVDGSVLKLAVQ